MLLAPFITVRFAVADLLPARSLRRRLAIGLLGLGVWMAAPVPQTVGQRLDNATHRVWQIVENAD